MYQHKHKKNIENVLILQGGGSLGAFACGVFKTFAKKNINFNIISGTSIGAINGAIAAGSKNDNPAKNLEDFWIEIAESSVNVIPDMFSSDYVDQTHQLDFKRSSSASLNAAIFGYQNSLFLDGLIGMYFNIKIHMIPTYYHINGLISMTIRH